MPHIVVGTAGHIDHGKTALVKALTGIDADRLKEEKERGITIDLGFANLELENGVRVSFIDVPGHERFIKNMLAGVGGIDAVMLVIAADEGVKPQTREHLDICSLLRIPRGFTVLTKVDRVTENQMGATENLVREFLKDSFLENAPILRVSALTGAGIPDLRSALETLSGNIQARSAADRFRLPVDRSFTMKGFGTVVTGTLIAGAIRKDDEVEILPSRLRARVRGIQVHGKATTEARAGQRTALNLHGVAVTDIQRGMVLAAPQTLQPTSMLDCSIQLLSGAHSPIRMRRRIRFHLGTAELMGYAVLLGRDSLGPGESGFAQIRLEQPTVAVTGDRFIIRQYSPMTTIGGGEVLDAAPRKRRRMDEEVVRRLTAIRQKSRPEREALFEEERRPKEIPVPLSGSLTPAESALRDAIVRKFQSLNLHAPRPDDIFEELKVDRSVAKKLLRLLVQDGVLVRVDEDLIVHRESLEALIRQVRTFKAQNTNLGVGEFKDLAGVSRKYAIPLLEYLDRQRVTRRMGNNRTIL